MDKRAAMTELDRLLTTALRLADDLDMTMVAIHIDEARNLLATSDITPAH
ncbi:hypothetical protein NF700_17145 [Sphingomonadaceae bacterium OTU29MARTA1]|nr:hypothetical protein [Sphingomonas sp. Leaf37]USU05119.1 hypothetical protein NF699_19150 [Sphingomonadaceae bacterium OTU29LAMAA1]USU08763.1 hypothetical protein NF700_17145 [Sphingomonadaceae bacterium OTU29MARTA1]USU12235.1 hypothetical protein NF701_17170 [Sphingomonadaceae bacterium OTU29THOMA1]